MHFDGEIYAAIGWRLRENFLAARTLTTDTLLTYLVDGMNYTPATPFFEDMRDGILAAAARPRTTAWCGTRLPTSASAWAPRRRFRSRSVVTVIESFALPAECSALRSTANAN